MPKRKHKTSKTKRINIIYDATMLPLSVERDSDRTGIFFVSLNLLKQFMARKEFNVALYCDPVYLHLLDKAVREVLPQAALLPVINRAKRSRFMTYKSDLLLKKDLHKEKKHILRKTFYHYLAQLSGGLGKAALFLNKTDLKGWDIFFSPAHPAPSFVAKDEKIKEFYVVHDVIPLLLPEYASSINGWLGRLISSVNNKSFYFANSAYTRQDFLRHVPAIKENKIGVIPLSTGSEPGLPASKNDIEAVREKYGIPSHAGYALSVSTFEPRKNILFTVKNFIAFIVKFKITNLVFVIAGSNHEELRQKLSAEIEGWEEYGRYIITPGYVRDGDLNALYFGAQFLIFMSVYEGFGLPVLEAMKRGCPVICSDVTSVPEVIGNCGITVNPSDGNGFIKALEKMHFNKEFREECSAKGFDRAKLFSWDKAADIITGKIKETLNC